MSQVTNYQYRLTGSEYVVLNNKVYVKYARDSKSKISVLDTTPETLYEDMRVNSKHWRISRSS